MGVIRRIEIKNFRSIQHLEIENGLRDINLLVGNNDIGKSNILRALNLFFNNQTDIGKSLDFWEDFNKNIVRTSGKGQYIRVSIDIDIKYERNKYVRWTKEWNNLGELRKNEKIVFDSNTHDEVDFENKSRGKSWLERIVFRYVPAIKSERYFQHLFEELHDLLSSSYAQQFKDNTGSLIQTIQEITEDITTELEDKLSMKNKISLSSDLKTFFSALDFSIEIGDQRFNLKNRGDGIKVRHIPIVLRFMAEKAKVFRQGSIDVKTIWAFEEPENNLEMSHAFLMAKSFLDYCDRIDIFVSTHSPAFYSLKDNDKKVACFYIDRNGENHTEAHNIEGTDVNLDEKMGMLWYITPFVKEKEEELRKQRDKIGGLSAELEKVKDTTKTIVFTEDEADDLEMIKVYLSIQGFKDNSTEYHSYHGKDNFHAAIVAADIMKQNRPNIQTCLFYRDMDVDGEYFCANTLPRLSKNGRKNYFLVMPTGYDLEAEFINAEHINSLYPIVSIKRINELIEECTKEQETASLKKLRETYMSVETIKLLSTGVSVKDFKWDEIISKVDKMYYDNPARYRYGKIVLGVLKSKLQKEIKKNPDLLKTSKYIIKQTLKQIADSIK